MSARSRRAVAGSAILLASVASLAADSRHVELAPVLAREMFPLARGGAVEVGGPIEAALASPLTIVREVPVAWELRVPLDTDIDDLLVELELTGIDGAASALSRAGSATRMPVRVSAGKPRVVRREARSIVVSGSARLQLRVDDVEQAGRYEGTLTVRLAPR